MASPTVREQVRAADAVGPEVVVALVEELVAGVGEHVASLAARLTAVEAENVALRSEIAARRGQLVKDSHNSSKPPASDGPGAPKRIPKSLRGVSGRRPGGQPGHPGHALTLVEQPDAVVVHRPSACTAGGHAPGSAAVRRTERRQVIDLPVVRVQVVEHQAEPRGCPACGQVTTAPFPADVLAPIQYGPGVATLAVYLHQEPLLPIERTGRVLGEVFGCPISGGTLERMVACCADAVTAVVAAIKRAVIAAPIVHVDETGLSLNGTMAWLHVASTDRLTWYATQRKREQEALAALGVRPPVRGRVVHDGRCSYWHSEPCAPALCNAHHLRELTFVAEHLQQTWAGQVTTLLLEIKEAAERDLRMMQVRQKISGCVRSLAAVDRFCQLRRYAGTLRKQGLPILASLADACRGHPPVPALT